jgi:23S rRNA pseudouridine2605 synthase
MGLRKKPYSDNKSGGKKSDSGRSFGGSKPGASARKPSSFSSDKPAYSKGAPAKRSYTRSSEEGSDRGAPKRSYTRSSEGGSERSSSDRRPSSYGTDRPRTGAPKRSYTRSSEGGSERSSSDRRPSSYGTDRPRTGAPKRSYTRSSEGGSERSSSDRRPSSYGTDRPRTGAPKRSYTRSSEGGSERSSSDRRPSAYGSERRTYKPREEGSDKPTRGYNNRGGNEGSRPGARRTYTKTETDFGGSEPFERKPRLTKSGKPYMVRGAKARDMKAKSDEMLEAATPDIVRLNRFISNAGICSRREADDLISAGLVAVNGEIITEMGHKVKPGDEVRYNNERLSWEKKVYLIMNKPKDTITTSDDPEGRKIIMDLIKDPRLPRVYPVGRLDRNTTGVIILTNDGEMAQRLTHPKYDVTKVYKATLNKSFAHKDLHDLGNNGVELEDGPIKPDMIGIPIANEKDTVLVQIHSGRNHIIHRMFEALGYLVDKLDRLEFAGMDKKGLDRGEWRHLDDKEIKKLKKLVQLK